MRDYQFHTSQFPAGKNFAATGGFGPWMVTPDEIADLDAIEITTRLNGEVMQNAKSAQMVFGFADLVSCHASSGASEFAMRVNARPGPQGISGILARTTTRQWRAWRTPEGRVAPALWPRCAPLAMGPPFPAGTRLATDPVGRAEATDLA